MGITLMILLAAQQDERVNKVLQEIDALKKQLQEMDALKKRVADLEQELKVMKLEAEAPAAAPATPPPQANVFNPAITVFGNLAARLDSDTVRSPDGDQVDDHFFLRSVEVDFRAAVDPYADAVATLAVEQEADGGFAVEAEEAYVVLKRLPILEDAPLGMKLKAGRHRPPFGIVNQLHLHDLPWVTRPEAVVKYLGSEGGSFFESGWSEEGAGISFLLPDAVTPEGTAVELAYHAMDTGSIAIGEGNGGTIPGHVARGAWFIRFDPDNTLNLGSSFYRESGHHSIGLYGADVMFKHQPDAFESVVVGGEVFYGDRTFDDPAGLRVRNTPVGWFAYVQYQPDQPWYLGLRYDRVEDVDDDDLETGVLGLTVSYYTSEFLRLRLGVEQRWSDIDLEDDVTSLYFELNWIFGAHPVEPFWVNR